MKRHFLFVTAFGSLVGLALLPIPWSSKAQDAGTQSMMMSPGLMMPSMNPANGRKLYASKGCVLCHSINGIGGKDAVPLDAAVMPGMINPFDFVAGMWRGAAPMIAMQTKELKQQTPFTGQELADIIAFVHDPAEQKKFSESDIPPEIKEHMEQ